MTASPENANRSIFTIFLLHGIVIGSWVPHIPLAKERLDVGPAAFGVALLSLALGAILAMPLAGMEINRHGSRKVTLLAGALFFMFLPLPALAPNLALFMLAGLAFGACIGSMDVAMNAHGIAVERALKRPIMSKLHGGFSIGGLVGAAAAALLLPWLGEVWHVLLVSTLSLIALQFCRPHLLPSSVDKGLSGSHFAWPTRATIGLGLLCFLALMSEGAVLDWAALYFREKFTLGAGTAALSYALFSGGMAASRLAGDGLRQRFGAVNLVTVSAIATAIAISFGIWSHSYVPALLAFIVAGVGIGNIAPVLFAGGGRLEPEAPGRGIAAVTTLGYAGFLAGPPLIGFIAQGTSLGVAFLAIVVACLLIAAFARTTGAADTY